MGGQVVVQPGQHERKRFAQVADDKLQMRVAVEGAAQDDAQDMHGRLDVPAPAGCGQLGSYLCREIPRVGGLDDRLRRRCGVQVDRHLQGFGPLEDGPEEWVIQVTPVHVTVDHGTLKTVIPDGAFQFGRSDIRAGGWQGGKPAKAVGMALDGCSR